MRVTSKMMYEGSAAEASRSREKLDKALREVSTGRRIDHPGDDPGASGLLATSHVQKTRFDAIGEAVGRANDEITTAFSAMEQMTQVTIRARELAMQLANATYNASDRANAAKEIDGLSRELAGLLNTQVGRRYLFAGFKDNAPPFDDSGNYSGDDGVRTVEIAPGVYEGVSVRADVFAKGAGGGVDIFAVMSDLATALRNNDYDAITGSFGQLDSAVEQLGTAKTELGSSQSVLDAAAAANRELSDSQTKQISALADVDVVDAATRLQLANTALEAALTATAQSFRMSLLDKLG